MKTLHLTSLLMLLNFLVLSIVGSPTTRNLINPNSQELEETPNTDDQSEKDQFQILNWRKSHIALWDENSHYDPSSDSGCSRCSKGTYCPLGSQIELTEEDMDSSSILSNKVSIPSLHSPDDPSKYPGSFITFSFFIAIIVLFLVKFVGLFIGDEKLYSHMSRIDYLTITGGKKKTGYGGIMLLWVALTTIWYAVRWASYMTKQPFMGIEDSRTINSYLISWYDDNNWSRWNLSFVGSYKMVLILHTSRLQYDGSNDSGVDLWNKDIIEVELSEYFRANEDINIDCKPIDVTNQDKVSTEQGDNAKQVYFKYRYELTLTNVKEPSSKIDNEWVIFTLKTDEYQIYHFYHCQFIPAWDANTVLLDKKNLNLINSPINEVNEKIFIGSEQIVVFMKTIPLFYQNQRTSQHSIFGQSNRLEKQYELFYEKTDYGSTWKTKENFLNNPNDKGFAIKFLVHQGDGFIRYLYVPYLGGLEVLFCIAFVASSSILLVRIIKSRIIGDSESPSLPETINETSELDRDI